MRFLSTATRKSLKISTSSTARFTALANRPTSVTSTARAFSSSPSASFPLESKFKAHLCDSPSETVTATKDEMLGYHQLMYRMRRMEITCDQEYKSRAIRGFCHLYDGQEAVATGIESALTRDDDWITTYRCHGVALARGNTEQQIFEELFGFEGGVVRGKGGSMHLYNKSSNFYGGAGIVGAQVPVGAGLGFYHKYRKNVHGENERSSIALAGYGDGTANQGQVWEAANMAQLWKLPVIFLCENNLYGMGTSSERSSANTSYYKQGQGVIPGLFIDGMDVLAVREGISFAKKHCNEVGPIFVEVQTYRYHGHSMSDPGISYRTRDEVSDMRKSKDPIELVKRRIIDQGWETAQGLKETEKEIRGQVQNSLIQAKKGKEMPVDEMLTDIYANEHSCEVGEKKWGDRLQSELPKITRMPLYERSVFG